MKNKIILSVMLSLCLFVAFILVADAAGVVQSGSCGTGVAYTLYDDGSLVVSGSGAMTSFSSASRAPWYAKRTTIKSVVVGEGVTSVGKYAFTSYANLEAVTLSSTVTSIGPYAFYECAKISSVTIPKSVVSIGEWSFFALSSLKKVTFEKTSACATIGNYAFAKCDNLKKITLPSSITSIGTRAVGYYYSGGYKVLPEFTIYANTGTVAETYASNNKIAFVSTDGVEIEGVSIVLDGAIGIRIYLNIPDEFLSNTILTASLFDIDENETVSVLELTPEKKEDSDEYFVTVYLAPKDADDVRIDGVLSFGDKTTTIETITMADYIATFKELAKDDAEFAAGLGLVDALEKYIKYADNFFSSDEALATVAVDMSEVNKIVSPIKSGSLSGVTHFATSLILEDKTTIRHYFKVSKSTAYTFKCGDKTLDATELGGGIISVDIPDIASQDLDEVYTVTVNDSLTVSYSAMNYAKQMISSSDAKLSNLAKALFNYWYQAEKYSAPSDGSGDDEAEWGDDW